jgi:glutamine---fructose-6-phosphate transaminase (isomerizing)
VNGRHLRAEMAAQPGVLRALVARRDGIAASARELAPDPLRGIVLVARGSSDNAALQARYLLEAHVGVPVVLAAPSLQTRYEVRPRLDGFLAVAISQSGVTPEIVSTLQRLAEGGAATLAITNVAGCALADAADATVLLEAGDEQAVPATKTFTAQVVALCLLTEALAPTAPWRDEGWERVLAAVDDALVTPDAVAPLAARLVDATHVVPIGRGFLYGAALEIGLKLAETTGIAVYGTSPADLRHGPIATINERTQAICLTAPGPVADDVREIARDLRRRGATVAAIAEDPDLVDGVDLVIPIRAGVPEALVGLPGVVRGQQLALATAEARGIDPDTPFALSKVTPTT